MRRRIATHLKPGLGAFPRRLGLAVLTAAVVALIFATVPDVTFAADPPGFDVPPTPPFGATLGVVAGELLEFAVDTSDADLQGAAVTQIATGDEHTCALLVTGNLRCWGRDQLHGYPDANAAFGDDETPASAYVSLPNGGNVDVGGAVTQIAAGNGHTCALLDTGAVRCWGWSDSGQVGYGNLSNIGDNETPASAGDVDVGGTERSPRQRAYLVPVR